MIHYNPDMVSNVGVCGELGLTTRLVPGVTCPTCVKVVAKFAAENSHHEVARLKARIAELEALLQWRSTADAERPSDNQRILVWRPYVFHLIAANYDKCTDAYSDDEGNYESFCTASHWMPTPKGPEVYH